MKRLLPFFMALLALNLSAQIKKQSNSEKSATPKIAGIGRFQIDKTTISVIDELSKENNVPVKETSDYRATQDEYNYNDSPSKILYISKEANEGKLLNHSQYIQHPQVKVYYINNMRIAGLLFHDTYLRFYKDTLYSFECDDNEYIDSALELKYGTPKFRKESKVVQCSNAYRDFNHEEWTIFRTWSNNSKNIEAYSARGTHYNDKCEEYSLEYFIISDYKKELLILDEIQNIEKKAQAKRDKERKKTLTDL